MTTIGQLYKAQLYEDLALSLSPILLAAKVGFPALDRWQRAALTSPAKQQLWNVARGCGKSQVAALLALSHSLNTPGSLTLLVSPSLRQSVELFKKVTDAYEALGLPQTEAESALRLELKNKSRIIALSSNPETARGYHNKQLLLVVDEAAFCSDDLIIALRPSLATSKNPKLVMLSTPWGQRGAYFEAWAHGGAAFERYEVKATECPRISKEFLQQELEALGPYFYAQEYECEFGENTASLFSGADVRRAYEEEVELFDLAIEEPAASEPVSQTEVIEWSLT